MTDSFYSIAYSSHLFANPVEPELLERALAPADLRPGQRAADLGCGSGAMALHLARHHGLLVDGVDMDEAFLSLARARLDAEPAGTVALHHARVEDFLAAGPEPYDLILVMGATQLVTAAGARERFFASLRPHLKPGGHLLYGDPFWRRPPSEALAARSVPYGTHAGYVRAGAEAGLQPRLALESSQAELDGWAWRMSRSIQDWLEANPGHPMAAAYRAQADYMLDAYLGEARDSLSFGLYLFRAP
jgi:SAM-dependent methyltransferase